MRSACLLKQLPRFVLRSLAPASHRPQERIRHRNKERESSLSVSRELRRFERTSASARRLLMADPAIHVAHASSSTRLSPRRDISPDTRRARATGGGSEPARLAESVDRLGKGGDRTSLRRPAPFERAPSGPRRVLPGSCRLALSSAATARRSLSPRGERRPWPGRLSFLATHSPARDATTSCSIAPKIEWPAASRISIRMRSPGCKNRVRAASPPRLSTTRCSARQE